MSMHNAPHPGEIVKTLCMEPLGLTVGQVADGLGVTRKALSELINGHSGISPMMAFRLSKAFDTSPELWMNLQMQYELSQVQDEAQHLNVRRLVKAEQA